MAANNQSWSIHDNTYNPNMERKFVDFVRDPTGKKLEAMFYNPRTGKYEYGPLPDPSRRTASSILL